MSRQFLQLFLPSIVVFGQLKMQVLAALQLHLIWFCFFSVGAGAMADKSNSFSKHTMPSAQVQLSTVSKQTTISEHQDQQTLST